MPFAPAARAGNGADIFKVECSECHSIQPGRNKKGPSLFGVFGRKAGSLQDYDYSEALKHADWTWTAETLHAYLSEPARKANPGSKMKYEGLDDPGQLQDLIAWLATQH